MKRQMFFICRLFFYVLRGRWFLPVKAYLILQRQCNQRYTQTSTCPVNAKSQDICLTFFVRA